MKFTELVQWTKEARLTANDKTALIGKDLYPQWKPNISVKKDERYQCDGILWKCLKDHTTQDNWKPSIHTASLWTAINEAHAGTIDDPIPVPEVLTSFEYEWGKYYLEGSTKYLCNRQGGKEGDKYTLAYKPSALVGHYFAVV